MSLKESTLMLTANTQYIARLSAVRANRILFPVRFLITMSTMAVEAVNFHLFFKSLHLFIFFHSLFTFEKETSAVVFSTRKTENTQYFITVKLYTLSSIIRYAWYVAKLITSCAVFCNVNQTAFPADKETAKCECSKQVLFRCSHCYNFCVFVAFTTITIRNPASLSPCLICSKLLTNV
jgi:hypothetical protein